MMTTWKDVCVLNSTFGQSAPGVKRQALFRYEPET